MALSQVWAEQGQQGGAVVGGDMRVLAAQTDAVAQKALFDKLVAKAYEQGKGLNMASYLEIDAVIDPAETRAWLLRGLNATPPAAPRQGKKRPFVATRPLLPCKVTARQQRPGCSGRLGHIGASGKLPHLLPHERDAPDADDLPRIPPPAPCNAVA